MRTDFGSFVSKRDYAPTLVEAMRLAGKGYDKVVYIITKGRDIHLVTNDAQDSHQLLVAMKKKIPPSFGLGSTATCQGLIQQQYMLKIGGYPQKPRDTMIDAAADAKKELEAHFKLKPGQIEACTPWGHSDLTLTTNDLDVLAKFSDRTKEFTQDLIINGSGHDVKPTTEAVRRRQCYNCQGFKHESTGTRRQHCEAKPACSRCAGPHIKGKCNVKPWEDDNKLCTNCVKFNETATKEQKLSFRHEATNIARCRHPDAIEEHNRIQKELARIDNGEVHWLEVLKAQEKKPAQKRKAPLDSQLDPTPRKRRSNATSNQAGGHTEPEAGEGSSRSPIDDPAAAPRHTTPTTGETGRVSVDDVLHDYSDDSVSGESDFSSPIRGPWEDNNDDNNDDDDDDAGTETEADDEEVFGDEYDENDDEENNGEDNGQYEDEDGEDDDDDDDDAVVSRNSDRRPRPSPSGIRAVNHHLAAAQSGFRYEV
ncbi:uncharacterized protein J4E78_004995 [Alternaria triticimaculans]|uniref:uncharacterized protein n=1 Tax=Alternaria triticimaculans TaxID=297637 RepID=UPI0020C48DAF|nr:uncharacterized protein J4E78_004995 [Alternaria triticimaculans]KAI4660294.1 hypothetical protein J4E78_004995 [Alternaria triticimaculans]